MNILLAHGCHLLGESEQNFDHSSNNIRYSLFLRNRAQSVSELVEYIACKWIPLRRETQFQELKIDERRQQTDASSAKQKL